MRDDGGVRVFNKNGTPKQSASVGTGQYIEVRDETSEEYEQRCRESIEKSDGFVEIQKIAQTNETL